MHNLKSDSNEFGQRLYNNSDSKVEIVLSIAISISVQLKSIEFNQFLIKLSNKAI